MTPKIAAQADVESSMLDLVRAGVGLSLVRESIAQQECQAGRIALAPVMIEAQLSLVCLARRRTEPALSAVFALAAALWRTWEAFRSEEGRVGKEGGRPGRSRWCPYH